jgi:hypothetical protein
MGGREPQQISLKVIHRRNHRASHHAERRHPRLEVASFRRSGETSWVVALDTVS